jgi:hypothetical protein
LDRSRLEVLPHDDARHHAAGSQSVLAAANLIEAVRLVEVDCGERRVDMEAPSSRGQRLRFGEVKQR